MKFGAICGDEEPSAQARLGKLRALITQTERQFARNHTPLTCGKGDISCRWKTGVQSIDNSFYSLGLEVPTLHEVRGLSHGESVVATGFSLALLKRLESTSLHRAGMPVLWCQSTQRGFEFGDLYGHALHAFGYDPKRFIFCESNHRDDVLWALEEGAKAGGLCAAVGEVSGVSFTQSRRLKLAAAASETPVLLVRPHDDLMTSAADTRWHVASSPCASAEFSRRGLGNLRWHIELKQCRGGRAGAWIVEWNHEAHRFNLVEEFSSRLPEATYASDDESIAIGVRTPRRAAI